MAQGQQELALAPMLLADTGIGLRNPFTEQRRTRARVAAVAALLCVLSSAGVVLCDPGCSYASPDELVYAVDIGSAGSQECDGRFLAQGLLDGKPRFWKPGIGQTIRYYDGWWLLGIEYGGKSWYAAKNSSSVPPQVGWVVGPMGQKPVPTVMVVMVTEGQRLSTEELWKEFGVAVPRVGIWLIIFFSCIMGRLLCAARSATKWRMVKGFTITIVEMAAVLVLARIAYLGTDCNDAPKGLSDVLLASAGTCGFVALLSITMAGFLGTYEAECAELLRRVADMAARQEPDVLILEVSEGRLRQFLQAESEHAAGFSVTNGASRGCTVLAVLMMVFLIVFTLADDHDPHRSSFWYRVFGGALPGLMLALALAWQVFASARCQSWLQRRKLRQQLAAVRGPARLLLIHNTAPASGSSSLDGMSAAFFEGRMVAAFTAQADATPGMWRRNTRASVCSDESDLSCAVLSMATTFERSSPALWRQQDARIEGTTRVPLDRGHETVVREWLEERREVFGYGVLEEVEMQ